MATLNKNQTATDFSSTRFTLLQEFYKNVFTLENYGRMLGYTDFNKREFGFLLRNGKFLRNISFEEPRFLLKFIERIVPQAIYIGAVYELAPSKENLITRIPWGSRELVFDLDINDYDSIRKEQCGCQGKEQFCWTCWTCLTEGAIFIQHTLEEDFGFQYLQWLFSGCRGLHCWVLDETAKKLTGTQRQAVVNYISLINHETIASLPKYPPKAVTLRKRLYEDLIQPYFNQLTKSQQERFQRIIKIKGREFFENEMIKLRYPRIDYKVTMDISRLMRFPGSVHQSTGKSVVLITNLNEFNPFKIQSIF